MDFLKIIHWKQTLKVIASVARYGGQSVFQNKLNPKKMKTLKIFIIIIFFTFCICSSFLFANNKDNKNENSITVQQVSLDANNIKSWIWNTGVFDQNSGTANTPGFEWPKGSGHYAIFTAGLTLAAYVNNQLRMAAASYKGEYLAGYCTNGTFQTNSNFKLYKVTRGDNSINNPDWANWGLMVPYGAPFEDINNNGIYEPAIDKAGVKGSAQTIFLCVSDGDPSSHTVTEGFGGGTAPLGAEVHFTAWCYDNPGYQDMQFLKWVVINKNTSVWDSTRISLVSDPDLGYADDDYIGCDTIRHLGYCYNADNDDAGNSYAYGPNPPASGFVFLNCGSLNLNLSSFDFFTNTSSPGAVCEHDVSIPIEAYNFMRGYKKDGTSWINVHTCLPTKFCYALDGWSEFDGKISNCGGSVSCQVVGSPSGDRRFMMNMKTESQRMNPGDTQVVQMAQLVARGSSNLNSVTMLRQLSDAARQLCENNFIIGISPVSNEIPNGFNLYQNYPNPFNPTTKIKFDIAKQTNAKIIIYYETRVEKKIFFFCQYLHLNFQEQFCIFQDFVLSLNFPKILLLPFSINNREYKALIYKLQTENYSETKKMVLIK